MGTRRHQHRCEPLGQLEISQLLGISVDAVRKLRQRDVLPAPDWVVSGRVEVWCVHTIDRWREQHPRIGRRPQRCSHHPEGCPPGLALGHVLTVADPSALTGD